MGIESSYSPSGKATFPKTETRTFETLAKIKRVLIFGLLGGCFEVHGPPGFILKFFPWPRKKLENKYLGPPGLGTAPQGLWEPPKALGRLLKAFGIPGEAPQGLWGPWAASPRTSTELIRTELIRTELIRLNSSD